MSDPPPRLRLGCLIPPGCTILLWLLALLTGFCAFPTVTRAQEVTIRLTKYSCQPHKDNAMSNSEGMCIVTASGGSVWTSGAACPAAWMGSWLEVGGQVVRCDDLSSLSYTTWNGLFHVDLRVSEYAAAADYGVQTITVRRLYTWRRGPLNPSAKRGRGPL